MRKKKWFSIGGPVVIATASLAIAGTLVFVACTMPTDDVGQQSGKLETLGSSWGIAGDGSPAGFQNVSAAWNSMRTSDSGGVFAVGTSLTGNVGGPEFMSWWWSTVGNSPNYTGGTRCDPSSTSTTCVDCGGVAGTGTTLPTCFGCSPVKLMGSPSLAADGHGNTVYVGLADTDGNVGNGAERATAFKTCRTRRST